MMPRVYMTPPYVILVPYPPSDGAWGAMSFAACWSSLLPPVLDFVSAFPAYSPYIATCFAWICDTWVSRLLMSTSLLSSAISLSSRPFYLLARPASISFRSPSNLLKLPSSPSRSRPWASVDGMPTPSSPCLSASCLFSTVVELRFLMILSGSYFAALSCPTPSNRATRESSSERVPASHCSPSASSCSILPYASSPYWNN